MLLRRILRWLLLWLILRLLLLLLLGWIFHLLLRLIALLLGHLRAPGNGLFLRLHKPTADAAPGHEAVGTTVAFDVIFRADVAAVGALQDSLKTEAAQREKAHTLRQIVSAHCDMCARAMLKALRLAEQG